MSISITPLHPLFAARVSGIDLSQPVDPDDFVAIQAALDQYAVLVFHGPTLTPEEQVTFGGAGWCHGPRTPTRPWSAHDPL